ncbi:MAG: hypothetical protein NT150_00990 [Bacteroidetes bacterium]|nr:hypothetical protein [Bacteroidota bacterium]
MLIDINEREKIKTDELSNKKNIFQRMKKAIFLFLFFVVNAAYGQEEYKILEKDPDQISNLMGGLHFIDWHAGYPFIWRYGAWASYNYKNKYSLCVDYRRKFFNFDDGDNDLIKKTDSTDHARPVRFTTIFEYRFGNRRKATETQFTQSKERHGNMRIINAWYVPVEANYSWSLRLGYMYDQYPCLKDVFKDTDQFSYTSVKNNSLLAGIAYNRDLHAKIYSNLHKRDFIKNYFFQFYADFLYSPMTYTIFDNKAQAVVSGTELENMRRKIGSDIGFRVGYRQVLFANSGMSIGFEFGKLPTPPGLLFGGYYLNGTMGFVWGLKV